MIKRILLFTLFLLLLMALLIWLSARNDAPPEQGQLPWEMTIMSTDATRIFGLNVGQITLKEMMLSLNKLSEDIAIFEDDQGQLDMEAYFGKTRLGIFNARLIAEPEVTQGQLRKFVSFQSEREGTPSGRWKYSLPERFYPEVNDMRIWKLVYIPTINYEESIIKKHFGEPKQIKKLNEQLEYWLFPQKGLALLYDKEGSEILYYSATDEFSRLEASLPMEITEAR